MTAAEQSASNERVRRPGASAGLIVLEMRIADEADAFIHDVDSGSCDHPAMHRSFAALKAAVYDRRRELARLRASAAAD